MNQITDFMAIKGSFDLFDYLAFCTLYVLNRHIDALQDIVIVIGDGVDERNKLVIGDFFGHGYGLWLRNKARILHAS